MTFLEAVQALSDGRCKGIKREDWLNEIRLKENFKFTGACWEQMRCTDILADDWQLVDEVQETVSVVRWIWNGAYPKPLQCPAIISVEPLERERHLWVKLTGTYLRPMKRKVKAEGET